MSLAADTEYDDLEEPPEDEACPPPADAAEAATLMRRLHRVTLMRKEYGRVAEAEVEHIQEWLTRVDGPLAKRAADYERALAGWASLVNADDPSRKTFRLPHGEVTVRKQKPRVEATTDQDTLALLDPGLRRMKLEADKNAIQAVTEPGEVVAHREGEDVCQAVFSWPDPDTGETVRYALPGVHIVVPTAPKVTVRPEVAE